MKLLLALVLPVLATAVFFQMGLGLQAVAIATVMAIVSVLLALTESPDRH
jgi:hypothetical protein